MFNCNRLLLARKRRGFTAKALADTAGVSAVTLSRLENGSTQPDKNTINKLIKALNYPYKFFFKDDPEDINVDSVSFRSLSKMSAKQRDRAISAGSIALEISAWIDEKFNLPEPDLLDFNYENDPETASKSLREYWGIGERPIGNMIHLLEAKGIRVFSLSENTSSVDAYSFWKSGKPYIFLNNYKTPEHSVMDAAHELGHLVLHKHAGTLDQPNTKSNKKSNKNAEHEANQFASAFLMPLNDIKARMSKFITISTILTAKVRWRVSAIALAYRLHKINKLTDWQYKSICIELGKRGYRKSEPNGIEREISSIWRNVMTYLWNDRISKNEIAEHLSIPLDEFENLICSVTAANRFPNKNPNSLHAVK